MRLLVIDDDPAIVSMMNRCDLARGAVASVRFATDDSSALGMLEDEEPVDIALVSIDSETHSGLSIFNQLSERSIRVPRVAMTARDEVNQVRTAIAAGATDVLLKPLERDDLLSTLDRVMTLVEQRRRRWDERAQYMSLRREVDHAAEMQRQVLPTDHPEVPGLDVCGIMRAAKGIGGDFYDSFRIDHEHVGFVVADVAGKGVSAAFYMAMSNTVLRAVAQRGLSPARVMEEVNAFLCQREIPAMYLSAFYAMLNTQTWRVTASNAGHPPIMRLAPGAEPSQYSGEGGPILGILPHQSYGEAEFDLPPGGTMVLYTDGVTEVFDRQRQQFGFDGLARSAGDANNRSAAAILRRIESAHAAFAADAEPHDDMTLMAIQRRAVRH